MFLNQYLGFKSVSYFSCKIRSRTFYWMCHWISFMVKRCIQGSWFTYFPTQMDSVCRVCVCVFSRPFRSMKGENHLICFKLKIWCINIVQRKYKTAFIDLYTGMYLAEIKLGYQNINSRTFESNLNLTSESNVH